MKLAVIGSRNFTDKEVLFDYLQKFIENNNVELIISGGAKGADRMAEQFAKEHGIETQIFKLEYAKYGRGAPFILNEKIIATCDTVIAFWDGESRGTKNALNTAEKLKKKIIIQNSNDRPMSQNTLKTINSRKSVC